jgi:HEAT repeat protein
MSPRSWRPTSSPAEAVPRHPEVAKLTGGDRRSIGRSPEVVEHILADPALFDPVFEAIGDDDPLVRMRAADAIEKVSARRPELLKPYGRRLLDLGQIDQQEVRWHVAQMLPRVPLTAPQRRRAVALLDSYLDDDSAIVRTWALDALARVGADDPDLRRRVLPLVRSATETGTPAMRARGRKLLRMLEDT